MQYLLPIFYTFFFLFLIYKLKFFKLDGISFKIVSSIFLLKVLSGVALALIYRFYYDSYQTSDVYKYFLDGKVVFNILDKNPADFFKLLIGIDSDAAYMHKYLDHTEFWYKAFNYGLLNDNRLVIRIHVLINFLSFGNFWVHSVIFSFFSFAGLTAIYKTFTKYVSRKYLLLLAVFFAPSVMFWSSAALKESLIIAMIGMLFFTFFKIIEKKKIALNLIFFTISILLMLLLKFYVLFSLIPGLIAYFVIKQFKIKQSILVFLGIYTIIIVLFFNSAYFSAYNLPEIISQKQHDFINMLDASGHVGSRIYLPELEPNFFSFVKNTPYALINSFFRPSFIDIHSAIVVPAFIESFFILILLLLSMKVFNIKKVKSLLPEVLLMSSFTITLFILIGLTTPVLGALVRYKVPALPFLFILFFIIIDFDKFKPLFKKKD